jgi:hypothetical protein
MTPAFLSANKKSKTVIYNVTPFPDRITQDAGKKLSLLECDVHCGCGSCRVGTLACSTARNAKVSV